MNSDKLNRLLREGFQQAETLEDELHDAIASVYIEAGVKLANRLRETGQNLTAASDWSQNEPPFKDQEVSTNAAGATADVFTRMMEASVVPLTQGTDLTFDIGSESAQALLDSMDTVTDQIAVGIKDPARAALAEAWNAGMSMPEAAQMVEDAIVGISDTEARLLSRTGLNAISNGSSHIAVQQLNARSAQNGETVFGRKRWLTAHDNRVRPTHADADGQTVPTTQPFTVGGASLQFPGDPSGPIDQIIQCRCVLLYEESADIPASTLPFAHEEVPMPTNAQMTLRKGEQMGIMITICETPEQDDTVNGEEPPAQEDMPTPMPGMPDMSSRVAWQGTLAVEGHPTDDGRYLIPGGISERELPLTLMAMTGNGPGHDGAQAAGSIDRIWREDAPDIAEGAVRVMGSGYFDSGEFGTEIARMVDEDTLNGISVDLSIDEVVFLDRETYAEVDESQIDFVDLLTGVYLYGIKSAKIMAATICAMPAFAEADDIALVASGDPRHLTLYTRGAGEIGIVRDSLLLDRALVASGEPVAPLKPPADWFEDPQFTKATPLTFTPDGRVYGHLALWDSCHASYVDRCVAPSSSRTNYSLFHTGVIEAEDGSFIPIGRITLGTNHAHLELDAVSARSHYDHTGTVGGFVRAGEDRFGIWLAGVVRHDLPEAALRDMRANPPSGDWRRRELVGVLCVPWPGYPVPRQVLLADGGPFGDMDVATLIAGLDVFGPIPPRSTPCVDQSWDANANVSRIPDGASASTLRRMYAWVDSSGDPTAKGSYKFPHHQTDTNGNVGAANMAGVRNALSRLGGDVNIPDSDKAGVERHLQRHMDDFKRRQGQESMDGFEFEASIDALSDLAGV